MRCFYEIFPTDWRVHTEICHWTAEPRFGLQLVHWTKSYTVSPGLAWLGVKANLFKFNVVFPHISEFIVYAISFDLYYIFDMIETSVFCLKQII